MINKGSQYLLWSDSQVQKIQISAAKTPTNETLRKLKTGDFISGEGHISGSKVTFKKIENVGLKKILGAWVSPTKEKYFFQDFNVLKLIPPNDTLNDKALTFSYSILPAKGKGWQIVFLSDNNVQVGRLIKKDLTYTIQILSQKTGSVLREINLRR